MAFTFEVLNGALNISNGDTSPKVRMSLNQFTPELARDRIHISGNFGKWDRIFYFNDFGEIGGEEPTDLEDAYDKLVVLQAEVQQANMPPEPESNFIRFTIDFTVTPMDPNDVFGPSQILTSTTMPANTVLTKMVGVGVDMSGNPSEVFITGGIQSDDEDFLGGFVGNIPSDFDAPSGVESTGVSNRTTADNRSIIIQCFGTGVIDQGQLIISIFHS